MIGRNRGEVEHRLHVVDGDELAIVDGSGSDDWQAGRASPHGMKVELKEYPGDLRGRLLRGTYRCAKGTWTIGTWVPTRLARTVHARDTWELEGVDTTVLLHRIHLRRTWTIPTGGDLAENARAMLDTYRPGTPLAIVDTDATARVPLSWEAGTPLLEALSEMVTAGGHTPIIPTRDGGYTAPLLGAASRRPVVEWADDQVGAQFVPELEILDRLLDVPNEVQAIATGGAATEGLIGRWMDHAAIARWGRHTETIRVEAGSQGAADALAAEHGRKLQAGAAELSITGPWEPVAQGDAATLTWAERDLTRQLTIRGWLHQWRASSPTGYTVQEVR